MKFGPRGTGGPDYAASTVLIVVPTAAAGLIYYRHYTFSQVDAFIAAVTLLCGVLFSGFTQITAMRMRLDETGIDTDPVVKRQFREAATHTLVGSLLSALLAAVTLVGAAFRKSDADDLPLVCCAAIAGLSSYLLLIFVLVARRMHSAYLALFEGGLPLPRRSRQVGRKS